MSANPPKVSLERQIKCVRREIGKRKSVYPRWVERGRMTQQQADEEREVMEAVLATLLELDSQNRLI